MNGIVILNPGCNIAGGESAIPSNFKIYGYEASTAQEYATTYGRTFIKDHDYVCTEKKATCTEGGLKTYVCSICGDTYTTETSVLGHNYSTKWTVDKAATCTEKGSQSRHCIRCNEKTDITEIAELGHTYGEPKFIWSEDNTICNAKFICTTCSNTEELSCAITEDTREAGCTEVGERIYTATCIHNNQVYRNEKKVAIPAKGHTYGEPQFIWSQDNTTCNVEFTCSTCDNVERLNCEVSTDVPNITCTEGGEIVYTATRVYNNKVYTDEKKVIVPPNGHIYGTPKFEWSEDRQACIAVFECVVGDDKQQEDCQVNSKVTINPTCEKNGIRTYTATCIFNGKEYSGSNTEEIIATGHDYGSPQFAWTGNNECSAKFKCSICGDVQTVKCTVLGKKTIDATCTKGGQTVYTAACKFGSNNKEKEYTDTKTVNNAALGHKFGQPTFTWSDDNTCKATSKCDRCKESITKKCTVTNKVIKEATCKDNGITVYTAVYKGEDGKEYTSTKEVKTSVKDHKYEYTNNEDGTHTVVCTVGGEKKTEQCSYKDKVCTKCGSKQKTIDLPYKDVKSGAWYHEAVIYVYDNGIMTGFANGNFGPADNLGRGQFATILYRMEGTPNIEYQAIFPDVSNGQFYSIPASWAYNTGVISGYNSGYFGPADTMTREQLATMMYRYAKYKGYNIAQKANLEKYPDYKKVSSFSNKAMQWAVGVGLISGDQGKLNPQGTASRAVTSIIIQRFMKAY
ncbi:MAG: S-layer homology domain-containing protein [Ruminococcus sp.]|nr:S-layer homology domain-containing protein [Ruminococcus sp.]